MLRTTNMCKQKPINISCASTQCHALLFSSPYTEPHGVRGLSKHYHLRLEPRLDNGKCALRRITCTCIACKNMLDKTWDIVIGSYKENMLPTCVTILVVLGISYLLDDFLASSALVASVN